MESELKALRKLKREMIMKRKKLDMTIAEVNMDIGRMVEEIEIAEAAKNKKPETQAVAGNSGLCDNGEPGISGGSCQ